MMLIHANPRSLRSPDDNRQAQWVPSEDVPSEVLLDSTLDARGEHEPGDELGQLEHERLRSLVHARVFGEAPEAPRIGRYRVLERLGSGGMGVVFSAHDPELDRKLAIKLLHDGKHQHREHFQRLLREALVLARLSHPNVVQVFDVGEHHGRVFVVMELVPGKTLRQWIRERPRSVREIVDAYLQAGRGLAAAHEAGIVHRDFKPDNVLIGDDGRVRVLDFGIAVAEWDDAADGGELGPELDPTQPLTRTGVIVGTPAYMAPEQHLGKGVGPRSDQFAFCVALYESLHRTRPFAGESYAELVENVIAGQQRALESSTKLPKWLRELLARGLSVDPQQRFPDMHALLRELGRDRVVGRRRLAIAATGLVLASAVTYYVSSREREHEVETAAMAGELASEGRRADEAERELRRREDAVTIAEASLLVRDSPVDALAKLRELHDDHSFAGAAWIIASDARQRGVPRAVSHWPEQLVSIRSSSDGRRALLLDPQSHELQLFDVFSGELTATKLVLDDGPLAFSSDGRFVAVRASDGGSAIELWEADAGATTRIAAPIEGTIAGLSISPQGDRFVVFMSEWGSRPWLFGRDGASRELPAGTRRVKFVPDSTALLLHDHEGVLRRFEPDTGALAVLLRGVDSAVEVSPDGRHVAAVTQAWRDRRVLVAAIDGSGTRELAQLEDGPRFACAWHPRGDALAIGGSEGGAFVIGLDGEPRIELPRHEGPLQRLAFSPDGTLLASGSQAGNVFVTRLSDGHSQAQPGHRSIDWVVFDDVGQLHTIDGQGTVRVWDPTPRQLVHPGLDGRSDHLDWSSQDRLAVAGSWALAVFSAEDGELLWKTSEHAPYEGLAWSATGDRLATTHGDGGLRVWSADGALERTVKTEGGEGGDVRWLGDRIAWGEGGVGIHLLDPDSGQRELVPLPSAQTIVALASDAQHHRAWVGSSSDLNFGSILAFDDAWQRIAEYPLGADGLSSLALIPGRNQLVYGTAFGDVFVLDGDTGERRRLGAHDDRVHTIELDALGRTLYTASDDGTARVWELETDHWRELQLDAQPIWSLARSPDTTAIATAHHGKLVIWRDDLPYAWPELRAWTDASLNARPARPAAQRE